MITENIQIVVEEASEEVLIKQLHVKKVDLQLKQNTPLHHTEKYSITEDPHNELVVRRGQEFQIICSFDRPYDVNDHDLKMVFHIGKDPIPMKQTLISMKLVEDSVTERKNPQQWQARLISQAGNDVVVGITTSCNCIIGEWEMKIVTTVSSPSGKTEVLEYTYPKEITIILNPWCSDDQCYMEDSTLLNEYVLNDSGCVHQGAYDYIMVKKWDFAQFEEGMLDISLKLLHKVFSVVDTKRADVVKISRALAQIVNSNDEGGILSGNWGNDYSGGMAPQSWTGSYDILKQYSDTDESVRYGQCWVFAAVLNTVCRAIGLPCRCVTNYESAHDSDGTTTIDKVRVKLEDGSTEEDRQNSEQTWNFHVWNEVWFKRPDLPDGFDGWQTIDATPQEESSGVMTCGPASVKAIKLGDCTLPYDARFIFAEVNGDCITWERENHIEWRQIDVDISSVGKRISTKIPDGNPYTGPSRLYRVDQNRLDLTDEYKFPEGSDEERLAVVNARSNATVGLLREEIMKEKDLKVNLKEINNAFCGDDVPVVVTITNVNRKRETRTVKMVSVVIGAIDYRSTKFQEIKREKIEAFTLQFGEEKDIEIKLKVDDYLGKLMENSVVKVTTETVCRETFRIQIQSDMFRFLYLDLKIEVPNKIKEADDFNVNFSFKNPLAKPLTRCILHLHMPRVAVLDVENQRQIPQKDVPPNANFSLTLKMKPIRPGPAKIAGYFECNELYNVEDVINITIERN